MDTRIYLGNIVSTARFNKNRAACVAKRLHERKNVLLEEWLATRDFYQRTVER